MRRAGWVHQCTLSEEGAVSCTVMEGYEGFEEKAGIISGAPQTGVFTALSIGTDHACALNTYGLPVCWGNTIPEITDPGPYTEIEVGVGETCALTVDGAIRCWATDDEEILKYDCEDHPQPPEGSFIQLTVSLASFNQKCARREDSTIACWGCGYASATVPTPTGTFSDIHAGTRYACGVETDGTLSCWGDDYRDSFSTIPTGTFTEVAVGYGHACALDTDGAVHCFGSSRYGNTNGPSGSGYSDIDAGSADMCVSNPTDGFTCW